MAQRAAGSVFLACLSALFPVAGTISCVNYKHKETCGLTGSSAVLPCSYSRPRDTNVTGMLWSRRRGADGEPEDLSRAAAYSGRAEYLGGGQNDCTLRLTDLRESDASHYYFIHHYRDFLNVTTSCYGAPGVRLYVPASAVSVRVGRLVKGQEAAPVAVPTVTEGQRIKLTCVPTCAASLTSDPAYVWYKDRRRLSGGGGGANAGFLSLDPVGSEDAGGYSCAAVGYEDLRSPAVDLRVRYGPRNTTAVASVDTCGGVATLTCRSDADPPAHEYTWYRRSAGGEEEVLQKSGRKDFTVANDDGAGYLCQAANDVSAQNSTARTLGRNPEPSDEHEHEHASALLIIVVASVSAGLVVVVMVSGAFLVVKMKKRGAGPDPDPDPDPNTYVNLDYSSMVPESSYDTLTNVTGRTAIDEEEEEEEEGGPIYANVLSFGPPVGLQDVFKCHGVKK